MWMRLLATTRRPACSRRSMILPVILRLVASGLMIEKVRSMAMDSGSPLIALAGDCLAGDCSGWAQPLGAAGGAGPPKLHFAPGRSEEHTSELQSLMRISYAVFCLKKKKRI